MKRIIGVICLFILISVYGCGNEIAKDISKSETYSLGKTPHCNTCNICAAGIIYKDDVLIGNEYVFSGLYFMDKNNTEILITDDYYSGANYYSDCVYYIDNKKEGIKVYNLTENSNSELTGISNGKVCDMQIIDEYLYYLLENGDQIIELNGYNLKTGENKQLASNVSWRYLYDFCGSIGVIGRNHTLMKISFEKGIEREIENFFFEPLGIESDESFIIYENDQISRVKFSALEDEPEKLAECENVYRTIFKKNQMVLCTLDMYGLARIYEFDFSQNELRKICHDDFTIKDFDESYVITCSEDGLGSVNLIDRNNGKKTVLSAK